MSSRLFPAPARLQPSRIRAIVPDGTAPCVCIAVAHPSRLYVTRGGIVTHNTTVEHKRGEDGKTALFSRTSDAQSGQQRSSSNEQRDEYQSGIPAGLPSRETAAGVELSRRINRARESLGLPGGTHFQEVQPARAGNTPLARAIEAFTRATGTNVVIFRNLTPEIDDFNGVNFGDGNVYINEDSQYPLTLTAAHEWLHNLKRTDPALYQELENEVRRQGRIPQWHQRNVKEEGRDRGRDHAIEELTAAAVSDALTDPAFLQRLAQRDQSTFKRVARAFLDFLNTLTAKWRDQGSNAYLQDVEAFRDKLEQVLDALLQQGQSKGGENIQALFQRVWHGTPHRGIEKTGFKLNKIGTGEGAQAYGWGMYFAGARKVAEGYRKNLSKPQIAIDGEPLQYQTDDFANALRNVLRQTKKGVAFAEAVEAEAALLEDSKMPSRMRDAVTLRALHQDSVSEVSQGQLYSANVPEDSDLLDWDKPLSEQPDEVQSALFSSDEYYDALFRENPTMARNHRAQRASLQSEEFYEYAKRFEQKITGRELYANLDRLLGDARAASEYLQSIGIPGLRYLDGNSRNAGEGSHNYVIWDEALLTPEAADIQAMFSRKQANDTAKTPAAQIRAAIAKAYGKLLDKLEAKGLVTLTQTQEQAIDAAAQARAAVTGESVESVKQSLMESVKNSEVASIPEEVGFQSWTINSDEFINEEGEVDSGQEYVLIEKIEVKPEHRGKGYGRALLRQAVAEAQAEHPGMEIKLAALPDFAHGDTDAMDANELVAFYESEGFEVSRDENDAYMPHVVMVYEGGIIDIKRSTNGAVEGFHDPVSGKTFLIADALTEETAPGTLMHEIGIHMAADGNSKMQKLIARADLLRSKWQGNPFVQQAQERMEQAGETSNEEFLAYVVTQYENGKGKMPITFKLLARDFIAAVRAWLHGKGWLDTDSLSVADLAAIARANAKRLANEGGNRQASGRLQRSTAEDAELAQAQHQFEQTERAYGGRAAYDKAKAAGKTKLNYGQWVQVRTDAFKAWFGDWEAVRAQQRLDAMQPLQVRVPDEWRGLSRDALRQQVETSLLELMQGGKPLQHPEIGKVAVVRKGIKKALASSADPAKLLVLNDLRRAFEGSFVASTAPAQNEANNVLAYDKLLARLNIEGRDVVAVFTVKKLTDGNQFYNAVTLEDGHKKTPVASPRDTPIAGEHATSANTGVSDFIHHKPTLVNNAVALHDAKEKARDSNGHPDQQAGSSIAPLAGLHEFSRKALARVNPDEVSKVVDPATGEPLVVYHGTDADFSKFEKEYQRAGQYGGQGFFFTGQSEVAGRFGSSVMPVFLSAKTGLLEKRAARAQGKEVQIDHIRPKDDSRDIWAVFTPTQIKSAVGNRGTFDGADPDIRHFAANNPTKRPSTTQDKAVMQAIADGKSARDVLRVIAGQSKNPFNRQVARLLLKAGITPDVVFGHIGKHKGNPIHGQYRGKTDAIHIAGSAEYAAERIFLHEAMHAATMRALKKPGLHSLQLKKLFEHVRKQQSLAGFYGIKNVDEFVAEVFTNPDFQRALRNVNAPSGSTLKTAWDGFVRILRSILGLNNDAHSALSQALNLGVGAVREDMVLRRKGMGAGAGALNMAEDQTETEAFKRWFGDSDVVDGDGKPLVFYHGGDAGFSGVKGGGRFGGAIFVRQGEPSGYGQAQHAVFVKGPILELEDMASLLEDEQARAELAKRLGLETDADVLDDVVEALTDGSHYPDSPDVMDAIGAIDEADAQVEIQTLRGDIARVLGYQAVRTPDEFDGQTVMVLSPGQIKSATGNNGNFDPNDPDIANFGTDEIARNMGNGLKSITVPNVKRLGKHKLTDWLKHGLPFLGRRQLVDVYGDVLPMAEYDRLAAQMEADKNESGAEADELVRAWAKLPDEKKLADLMHEATLAQIDADADVTYVAGDDKAQSAMLKGRFKALTPKAQDVYRKARDGYRAHHAQVRKAIRDRIERSELSHAKRHELLTKMDDDFFQKVKGVYFPLARFGKYVTVVKDGDGQVVSVSRAETMNEAESGRAALLKAFPKDKGFSVSRVTLDKDFVASHQMVGRGFMTELYSALQGSGIENAQLAELEDTLGQLYLSSLPDLSWAKHGIHRKGTPGFSQDARRAFAQNTFHGARYLAKLRYSDLMQDELDGMQTHVDDWSAVEDFDQPAAQRVVDEMRKRHEAVMNPQSSPLSTALTSFGFLYYLGLSPAAAVVNLSQTALVAYPIMAAKWGYGKTSAALLKASKEAMAGKNDMRTQLKDAAEIDAYDKAVNAGVIDVTQAHDLAGIAQGEDQRTAWKLRPVMRAASFLFHHAEKFNRQATFIAAFRLARDAKANPKDAYEQAVKATYDGHFNYTSSNRPRVMMGNTARVVLLFKQFAQNMIYTMSRQAYLSVAGKSPAERKHARKVFAALIASHAMGAGVLGLPLVGPLLAVASMLGSDDDEPWDAEVALRNMLADAMGSKASEVIAKGVSRLTPWDISGRVGLDDLIFPDVREGLEGQRWAETFATGMLGPVVGIGVNAAKAAQKMGDGDYGRALEDLLPVVTANGLKAFRFYQEGAQALSGESIKDEVGMAGVLGQAAGFSPSEVRLAQEGKTAVLDADRRINERRSELMGRFAKAAMAKDSEAMEEANQAIARFNAKNPSRIITVPQRWQGVRQREKRIREAQDGVYLPRNRRDALEAGGVAFGSG